MQRLLQFTILMLIPLQGCTCVDEPDLWEFEERLEEPDVGVDAASEPDLVESDAGFVREPSDDTVVDNVPRSFAGRERTSLAVDDAGTVWLGYHRCIDLGCDQTMLAIAHRRRGQDWVYEDVQRQSGTFGIDIAQNDRVVGAYLSPLDNTFKVARRTGSNDFEIRTLGVRRTGPSDGLDIARDDDRIFVTFANERDPVSTFVLEDGAWSPQERLEVRDASAAYERGLRADGNGNLFLVHQDGRNHPFGLAQFSLAENRWVERTYFDDMMLRPSSLVVTSSGELCMSSHVSSLSSSSPYGHIGFTCGDMDELEQELETFPAEETTDYSSMLEGTDGTLYIAFNDAGRDALRLGKRTPGGAWTFEDVYRGTTYGVSTVIDKDDLLIISFYDCDGSTCSLQVITRPQ